MGTDITFALVPLAVLGLGGPSARSGASEPSGYTGPALPGNAVRLAVPVDEPVARPVFAGAAGSGRPRAIAGRSSAPATCPTTATTGTAMTGTAMTGTTTRATADRFGAALLGRTHLGTTHFGTTQDVTTYDGTTLGDPSSRRPQS